MAKSKVRKRKDGSKVSGKFSQEDGYWEIDFEKFENYFGKLKTGENETGVTVEGLASRTPGVDGYTTILDRPESFPTAVGENELIVIDQLTKE